MNNDLTGREDFVETWLSEMPSGSGSFETFDMLAYSIKDLIRNNAEVIDIGNGVKKISGSTVMFYWYQPKDDIILATELYVRPQGLIISATGKNPASKGRPPFASDLYNAILTDTNKSVRLYSDSSLSDEGYALWKRLFSQGHKISVYDKENPGKTFKTFDKIEDFDNYFKHDDANYRRYQFILSEHGPVLGETRSLFHLRRYRELVPGLL